MSTPLNTAIIIVPRAYYADAARWAYSKGMIGADFDPKADCTRADAVSYIWQAKGKKNVKYYPEFIDVPTISPYAAAVAWAWNYSITEGTSATTFNPNGICNRGEIVTFLYRAYK